MRVQYVSHVAIETLDHVIGLRPEDGMDNAILAAELIYPVPAAGCPCPALSCPSLCSSSVETPAGVLPARLTTGCSGV